MQNNEAEMFPVGTRVTVINDTYGRWLGMTGVVIPTPIEIKCMSTETRKTLEGTVWVRPDGWSSNAPIEPGFAPQEITSRPVLWQVTWVLGGRKGDEVPCNRLMTWAEVEHEMQADEPGRLTTFEAVVQ